MKKMKLLPLLGVSLLTLVGCSSGGNEISRTQARSKYDPEVVNDFYLQGSDRHNGIDTALRADEEDPYYPVYIKDKKKSEIGAVASVLSTTPVYSELDFFQENAALDVEKTFFNAIDDRIYTVAEVFQEKPTYTVDGRKSKVHFTGSTSFKLADKEYGLAMYLEANFDKYGLLTEASYEMVAATDLNDKKEADTLIRFTAKITCTYEVA